MDDNLRRNSRVTNQLNYEFINIIQISCIKVLISRSQQPFDRTLCHEGLKKKNPTHSFSVFM